jgi:large subunit ribosomal protein L22
MPVISKLNYLRIAPRKVRLVADLIRRQRVDKAERILNFTVKKAAKPIAKLLKTAVTDARHNFQIDPDNLYISKIFVNEGPKYKRWRARSRGMANPIMKRTSHIILVLEEIEPQKKDKAGLEIREKSEKSLVQSGQEAKEQKGVLVKEKEAEQKAKEKAAAKKDLKPKIKTELFKPKPKSAGVFKKIFRRKAI